MMCGKSNLKAMRVIADAMDGKRTLVICADDAYREDFKARLIRMVSVGPDVTCKGNTVTICGTEIKLVTTAETMKEQESNEAGYRMMIDNMQSIGG